MLRQSLAQLRLYSHKIDLTQAFDFLPATSSDLPDIVDFCTGSFIKEEPHSRALGMKPETSKPLFEYIAAKYLHYPYSYRVHEKGTKNLIGVRLLSIGHRDYSLDVEPIPFVTPTDPAVARMCEILDQSKDALWKALDSSINKVVVREITHIVPRHQRKGIANYLLHLGLDFVQLRKQGIQGITSEASSQANQSLLAKNGYKCIYTPNYKLKMDDGTKTIMVYFKDLR
ncbi:unnamed protein product [Cylicocyclus nassatus]|uniref:N-acetyltransferase domain-containing protein n=1 Tax=Cylicocyclus nassatus TaxID=53992 RepID=A0AA36GSK8_CYLNA|nr:unnamed protein product [Cylicocyclus nassatus]